MKPWVGASLSLECTDDPHRPLFAKYANRMVPPLPNRRRSDSLRSMMAQPRSYFQTMDLTKKVGGEIEWIALNLGARSTDTQMCNCKFL